MHYQWGDERINWKMLNQAGSYIEERYYKATNKQLMWKEKYGTIRYELLPLWLDNHDDLLIFCSIVKDATIEFAEVDALICCDLTWTLDEESKSTRLHYFIGYFEAITNKWNIEEIIP